VDSIDQPETQCLGGRGCPQPCVALTKANDQSLHTSLQQVVQLLLASQHTGATELISLPLWIYAVQESNNLVFTSQSQDIRYYLGMPRRAPNNHLYHEESILITTLIRTIIVYS
jgi:hypothetical protein